MLGRGQDFFNKCYGKVAERVITALDHSGTEDLGLAVRITYGYVLSTTAVLSDAETSFVMIAGLIPQDVSPLPFIFSPVACAVASMERSMKEIAQMERLPSLEFVTKCCDCQVFGKVAISSRDWANTRRLARYRLMRPEKNLKVNPQLKGHLKGALNGGASVGQVRAVRQLSIHVCEAAGMRVLTDGDAPGGWVWRTEVQDLL